jgi:hypothetical protein
VLSACPTGSVELQERAATIKSKESTEVLDLAEDVWLNAVNACPEAIKSDATLQILMDRLAQHP